MISVQITSDCPDPGHSWARSTQILLKFRPGTIIGRLHLIGLPLDPIEAPSLTAARAVSCPRAAPTYQRRAILGIWVALGSPWRTSICPDGNISLKYHHRETDIYIDYDLRILPSCFLTGVYIDWQGFRSGLQLACYNCTCASLTGT